MIYAIIYVAIGALMVSGSKIENDNSAWSAPSVAIPMLLLWPVCLIYMWATIQVIRWNGKEIWRRK